jgi:hypothetical protein
MINIYLHLVAGVFIEDFGHAFPFIFSETRFFGYDGEAKKYNAEAHRARIFGTHVADYMRLMKDGDEDGYKRQFAKFISAGIEPDGVCLLCKL